MDEGSDRPRRRPTYGLPGPAPAPGSDPSPSSGSSAIGPATAERLTADAPRPGSPDGREPGRRVGLLIGLGIGSLALALVAAIAGFFVVLSATAGAIGDGPDPFGGPSTSLELSAGQMTTVYVPVEDAETATCTAQGEDPSSFQSVHVSGEVPGPDGRRYEQVMGVVAQKDTTVTLTCEGTDAAATIGPLSMWGVLAPMLIGGALALLLGLVGLVLLVIGIIRAVSSRGATR